MFEYFLCVFSTFGSLVVVLGVHPVSSVLVQVIALLFKSIFHACIRFFQKSCAIYCAWLALISALEIQFSDCTCRQQSCITQTVRIYFWLGFPILQGGNKLHSCFSRENAKSPLLQTDSSGTAVPFKRGKKVPYKILSLYPVYFSGLFDRNRREMAFEKTVQYPAKVLQRIFSFFGLSLIFST